MNIVVSDPKTRKAYSKKIDNPMVFAGKKIGEKVELGIVGLEGYAAEITGGSDKQGFPMRKDLEGTMRKRIYIVKDRKKGVRHKIAKRGNVVSGETAQLNLKVIKEGKKPLQEILGGEKKEEKMSAKEELVKTSLENVGKETSISPKDIKKGR
ncbi:MAG: S6e family ribosomal protein [archaeon]